MELRQLKTFQTVATLLHFKRAADRLNMAQSTVSAQIQALEADLGVPLFERLNRRILLTPAGERLLQYAGKLLDLQEESRAAVTDHGDLHGSLTIRVPESLCTERLPPVIAAFHARFPRVKLDFTTCSYHGLDRDLGRGLTDLAFLLADSFSARRVEMRCLATCRLTIVAPPGHRLSGTEPITPAELTGETLLLSRSDCSYRQMFQRLLAEAGVENLRVMEINSVAAIRRCVAQGVGLSILPDWAASEDLATGRICEIKLADGPLEAAVLMLWHTDKWISAPMAAFMEMATTHLSTPNELAKETP